MRRQRRSPALLSAARPLPGPALTGPWPTVTRSQGARHTAPPSLPHAAARAHRAPSPEYRPAAARSHWARLVRIAPTACRHPRHPLALRRPRGPSWQEPRRMHPFFAECAKKALFLATSARKCMLSEIKMATSSPHASISGRNRAIQDAWRANLAAKGPLSRRGARNHAWREDVASAARPFRGSGMRSGRTGFAPCDSGMRSGRTGFAPCSRASPSETRHAVPVPMHLATCAPHPSRQPRGPTASRKQAEQHKQLNAGIKIGSPNRDPIEELFGFAQRLPDALQPLHQANELALSYLDHSTRQRLGGYVIGLSGNSFTVDLYAALVDHATSIAR